jgi:CheY-like chemotaxis protein
VFLAGNGREALAVLRDDPAGFDLVLMDVQMPEMDGLQATRALRQDQVLQKLPVVALTAGALAEERRRALDAGMDHFLTKPLDPDQLVDTVAGVLGRQGVLPAMDAADETTQPAPRGGLPSDWPHIDGIDAAQAARRLGGDTGLLRRSLQRLFDEFGEFTDLPAPSNLQAEDARRLAGRMHKLRGAAGLIDALELHRLAGELENGLRDGAAEADLASRWTSMQAAIRRLHLAAAPWLDQAVPVAEPSPDQPPASDEELRRLLDLLSRHDLDALPLFESRRAALHKRLGSTRLNDLAARVDALDFSSAVALLQGELTDGTPS